jgi:hypothetical protein
MADRERTLRLAAEIISAHATNNAVPSAQLPALIQQVFSSLATVEQKTAEPPKPDPAVPIGQSVRAGHIVGLVCGKHFSMLKRHFDDRSSTDASAVSPALGACRVIPLRGAQLREGTLGFSQEDRARPEGYGCKEEAWTRTSIGESRRCLLPPNRPNFGNHNRQRWTAGR